MKFTMAEQQTSARDAPHSLIHNWNYKLQHIRRQLFQLRITFNKASFLLAKRDFERIGSLELTLFKLQQKVYLFNSQQRSSNEPKSIATKEQTMIGEITKGLVLLTQQLYNLHKDKFEKKINQLLL